MTLIIRSATSVCDLLRIGAQFVHVVVQGLDVAETHAAVNAPSLRAPLVAAEIVPGAGAQKLQNLLQRRLALLRRSSLGLGRSGEVVMADVTKHGLRHRLRRKDMIGHARRRWRFSACRRIWRSPGSAPGSCRPRPGSPSAPRCRCFPCRRARWRSPVRAVPWRSMQRAHRPDGAGHGVWTAWTHRNAPSCTLRSVSGAMT